MQLQDSSRAPIMFDKEVFFQIEAEVVKDLKHDDYINRLLTEHKVQ